MGLPGPHPRSRIHPLIAQGRYDDAYMVNWVSNVFPGILGRTCDRPCEPACRRGPGRGEQRRAKPEPVAICRLKRVAADNKDDVRARMPQAAPRNGKRVACVGAGPASLTVARDLAPLGYESPCSTARPRPAASSARQIPRFRLPESVIDEEVGYILDLGVEFKQRPAHRLDEGAAGRGLRRGLRRQRRAARPRPGRARPQGSRRQHPHRHRLAGQRCRSATSPRSASA
jgi:formate dehydrogenase beta subunit